jgi:hypothetical protein
LDEVEKVLRGDAEQSRIRLVLRNFDAKDRSPIHPAECLEIAPIIENRYVLANANFASFATAPLTIFCFSSEEMLCFFTTSAIGHLPSLDVRWFRHSFRHPR